MAHKSFYDALVAQIGNQNPIVVHPDTLACMKQQNLVDIVPMFGGTSINGYYRRDVNEEKRFQGRCIITDYSISAWYSWADLAPQERQQGA